jgi:hypothetical protein
LRNRRPQVNTNFNRHQGGGNRPLPRPPGHPRFRPRRRSRPPDGRRSACRRRWAGR